MNIHALADQSIIYLAALFSGKHKFFSESVESPGYTEHLRHIQMEFPAFSTGITELQADTLAGTIDPAFDVYQLKGKGYPTILYHHGNNERPFDFGRFTKNSFQDIFVGEAEPMKANLINIRAPFHDDTLRFYQQKISRLSNFVAMLSASVVLLERLTTLCRSRDMEPVLIAGISLGGWITNLHRAHYDSADAYVPLLAGAALGDVFTDSAYQRMTGPPAQERSDMLKNILNFEEDFLRVPDDNVFPLLAKYDQYIQYESQKTCYVGHPIQVLEKGHATALLATDDLREHILQTLEHVS